MPDKYAMTTVAHPALPGPASPCAEECAIPSLPNTAVPVDRVDFMPMAGIPSAIPGCPR
jgi:hypothetical protein